MLRIRELVLAALLATTDAILVSVLSGHSADAWSSTNTSCSVDGSLGKMKCNLAVYEKAAEAASANGAQLLVHPEGYGISGNPTKAGYWETEAPVTSNPCVDSNASIYVLQRAISCSASFHKIAIATNLFLLDRQGNRRITEIVFDNAGTIVASHQKIHTFPITEHMFVPGNQVTTFHLLGHHWGILICYEGAYPYIGTPKAILGHGNFSQMIQMKAQGADTFVWSIGGMLPDHHSSAAIAKKFNVSVVASEGESPLSPEGAVVDSHGKEASLKHVALNLSPSLGYTGKAFVQVAVLPTATAVPKKGSFAAHIV